MPPPALALFPSIDAASTETSLAPVSKADALGHLLASSAALLIDGAPGRDENLSILPELIERAACYEIRLGRDVLASPASLAARIEAAIRAAS
jgi:hypothetical protein